MMAVVEYADGKAAPPPELELGWNMRTFGGLPLPGGMLDQPMDLMKLIRVALNVESIWHTYRHIAPGQMLKWKKANPNDWKTVRMIEEMLHGE